MEGRISKTEKIVFEEKRRTRDLPPRMSEEIARNISNNLLKKKRNQQNLGHQESGKNVISETHKNILNKKSREISFNNTFTQHTLNSSVLESASRGQSFGDPNKKGKVHFLNQDRRLIGASKDFKKNAWSSGAKPKNPGSLSLPEGSTRYYQGSLNTSAKENMNFSNHNIIKSNFTLNPKNEYDCEDAPRELANISEEPTDHSQTPTSDQLGSSRNNIFLLDKKAGMLPDNSTVSSTIHSKLGHSREWMPKAPGNPSSRSLKKWDLPASTGQNRNWIGSHSKGKKGRDNLQNFGQKTLEKGCVQEEDYRKTQSKALGNQNMVKDLILNRVNIGVAQPIQVYNIAVKQPALLKKELPKKPLKNQRPKKAKKPKRYRGEVSSEYGFEMVASPVDLPGTAMPLISEELKRFGISGTRRNYVSDVTHGKQSKVSKISRGVKTENLNVDSRGFGFSKRNIGGDENESYLDYTAEEINLSRHNKFVKNPRKQRSNIKINFGGSLTPKKRIISKSKKPDGEHRKSKSITGKKLFERMNEHKIHEEVQKRLEGAEEPRDIHTVRRKAEPVKIRSHDDVMKKSIDFINGMDPKSETNGVIGSLAESFLKKKEISQVSLDYMGL